MKAVIHLDVPRWQIDKPVRVYFPDTMVQHSVCEEDEEDDDFSFSEWLENELAAKGMTQHQLAEIVGTSQVNISYYITCRRSPMLPTFMAILDAFGKTIRIVDKECNNE